MVRIFPNRNKNINTELSLKIGKIIREERKLARQANQAGEKTGNLFLQKTETPNKINIGLKCIKMEEGEYRIIDYFQTTFRNKQKTFLHLESMVDTKKEYLTSGYWIEEDVRKIEENRKLNTIPNPVVCRLGIVKTTPSKKKARTCTICYK